MAFRNKNTFTLIEMLVVVVIVGILAAALITRLQNTQARTRDVIRKKDIKTAADALVIYYQDNQSFPLATDGNNTSYDGGESTDQLASGGILKSLVPAYVSKPFNDPLDGKKLRYAYGRNNFKYEYDNGKCCAAFIAAPNRCNMKQIPMYSATLMYRPEHALDTDRFRSCPDGTPRDLKPGSNPTPPAPQDYPINRWMRGMWIYDDQIMAVGDNFDFSTVKHAP